MTFNGYIFLATVGGYGLGYWLFGLTMMQLSAKNLMKSQDIPVICKNCTRINTNGKYFEYYYLSQLNHLKTCVVYIDKDTIEDSASTDISDDVPGPSSMIKVEIHHSC